MIYGDGVGNINIEKLLKFHRERKTLATVTAAQMPGRFGALNMQEGLVNSFQEKPHGDGAWVSGGFFVLSPKVISYIKDDETIWEREPMERLAHEKQMSAYLHEGFWQPMDTLPQKNQLEALWASGQAPWKIWV